MIQRLLFRTRLRGTAWLAALFLGGAGLASGVTPVDFSREILPILSDHCFACHGPDAKHRKGDLRLDEESAAKRTHEGRSAIVPGRSMASEVHRRIVTTDTDDLMPPPKFKKPLSTRQIELLTRWIEEGARWGTHWAFAPLKKPPVPDQTGTGGALIRNPIDALVRRRLDEAGLTPSPETDRRTLIRRVSLDLTGLPPSPAEVRAFLEDGRPDAYDAVVDRLLSSAAYGERMAWDWMEAARYADSNGYQGDAERTMWPWRDWVVAAFNRNLSYDQFTVWQLAGDLLPDATSEQRLATGFCRNHPINGEGGRIPEENRIDYAFDMTETMGTVWLGLTLNCARCHDHKFDPIQQREYYSFLAFFNQTPVDGSGGDPQTRPVLEMADPGQREKRVQLQRDLGFAMEAVELMECRVFTRAAGFAAGDSETAAAFSEGVRGILRRDPGLRNRGEWGELEKEFGDSGLAETDYVSAVGSVRSLLEERESLNRSIPRVMVMEDLPAPRRTYVLDKGLYTKPGAEVTAVTPASLPPLPEGTARNRLALARWLVSPENPLTARVTVNRLWQMFFGIGLVKTAEDFGLQGELPRHAELLDWLAAEFRDSGWDLKRLIRLMVTSATYRQSSRVPSDAVERDPENRWLARGPRFRMPSWMIRDQALAASGLLVHRLGGPPVRPYQPPGVWEEATFGNKKYVQDHGEALYRRSLYTFWRRIVGPTQFFDTPSRAVCSVKPTRTNIPLHALSTLNDVTYVEAARALAQRTMRAAPDDAGRLSHAFERVTGRWPTVEERRVLLAARQRAQARFANDPAGVDRFLGTGESPREASLDPVVHAAWMTVCLTILNLDETLTKE